MQNIWDIWTKHAKAGKNMNDERIIDKDYFDRIRDCRVIRKKGNTYYLNPSSGAMVTGWQKIEGYDYYFNASGVLQKDAWIGNYYVDESGRWIPGKTK